MTVSQEVKQGRRRFLLLVALFLGPLVAALVLYYGVEGWRPSGSAAHGELIAPVVPLALDEQQEPPFGRVWTFVVVGDENCAGQCAEALVKVRQIRLSVGKEMERIGRVLLLDGDAARLAALLSEHPGLTTLDSRAGEAARMRALVPGAAEPGGWIYLVDPLGNLMMRFPTPTDNHDIRADLKRLLKLSRIG